MKHVWLLIIAAGVAVAGRPADSQAVQNLKMIGLAFAQYSSDYSDKLPNLASLKDVQKSVANYLGQESVFLDPETGEPLGFNRLMAYGTWQADADSILAYTRPRTGGHRYALFNDGHVSEVSAATWDQYRQQRRVVDDLWDAELQNLDTIGKALAEYVKDGDKTLPPLNELAATKNVMLPYTKMQDVFVQPGTKIAYAANTSLASRKFSTIQDPSKVVVFYEAAPSSNQTRAVLFLDGKVERIAETNWPGLKTQSGVR